MGHFAQHTGATCNREKAPERGSTHSRLSEIRQEVCASSRAFVGRFNYPEGRDFGKILARFWEPNPSDYAFSSVPVKWKNFRCWKNVLILCGLTTIGLQQTFSVLVFQYLYGATIEGFPQGRKGGFVTRSICVSSSTRDEALVVLFRETGDEGHYNEIYHRHHVRLAKVLQTYYTGDNIDFEAIVSQVFTDFYTFCCSNEQITNVQKWLFRAAKNCAIHEIRKVKSQKRGGDGRFSRVDLSDAALSVAPDSPLDTLIVREDVERVYEALPDLPEFLATIAQYKLDGWDNEDIAEALGIPVGTVKSRWHRAVMELKDRLKQTAKCRRCPVLLN